MKPSLLVAFLVVGMSALGGCSTPVDCSGGNYRGGCLAGGTFYRDPGAAPAAPVTVAPPPVSAAPAAATPASSGPTRANAMPYGDPASFADVDDKQCRSYGLTFGTHDYADCRIRLSAQHRGLDPNAGSGSR
jgi:hypothetical protein